MGRELKGPSTLPTVHSLETFCVTSVGISQADLRLLQSMGTEELKKGARKTLLKPSQRYLVAALFALRQQRDKGMVSDRKSRHEH